MSETWKEWREAALAQIRLGRRLEKIARMTELPFTVRPQWPGLDWCVWNESLEDFSARVKTVAARLGAADKVGAQHWLGAHDGNAPDLVAEWTTKDKAGDVRVTVRAMSPVGCKVDPRTEFVEAKSTALHPECVAVLKELEDLDKAAE